jgi:hypothetical protein
MDYGMLDQHQRPEVSAALIQEIDAIEKQLAEAFVQAALEFAYRESTALDRQRLQEDEARALDERATEIALEKLEARHAVPGIAHRPKAASAKHAASGSMFYGDPTGAFVEHESVAHEVPAQDRRLDELGHHATTVQSLAVSWAAEMKPRIEAMHAERELQHQLDHARLVEERQRAFKAVVAANEAVQAQEAVAQQTERQVLELQRTSYGAQQHRDEARMLERKLADDRERLDAAKQEQARVQERQEALAKEQQDPIRRDSQAAQREQREREQAQAEQDDIARWNQRDAAEAYGRALRAQGEIDRGGDRQFWEGYANRDQSMTRGLRAPEKSVDGAVNGATTQHYAPKVKVQTRNVHEESREHQFTKVSVEQDAQVSLSAKALIGMGPLLVRSHETRTVETTIAHEQVRVLELEFRPVNSSNA